MLSNRVKYPEAWKFFEEQARNIMEEPTLVHLGNYRIPNPDNNGEFIYTNTVEKLWCKFIDTWNNGVHDSESLYRKIQYITTHFNH